MNTNDNEIIMKGLKYTVIKTSDQYNEYCNKLEKLLDSHDDSRDDEIDLLTLLIEKWDDEHTSFNEADPIILLKALMNEQQMKAKDLVSLLGVSKGLVSDILNYKKGLSKEVIRELSDYFKISQEAFNRPYELINAGSPVTNAPEIDTIKKLKTV